MAPLTEVAAERTLKKFIAFCSNGTAYVARMMPTVMVTRSSTMVKPRSEQRRKLATVLLGYCSKLQPQTAACDDVANLSISANLPLTYQEIHFCMRANRPERGSL